MPYGRMFSFIILIAGWPRRGQTQHSGLGLEYTLVCAAAMAPQQAHIPTSARAFSQPTRAI